MSGLEYAAEDEMRSCVAVGLPAARQDDEVVRGGRETYALRHALEQPHPELALDP